jgi:hypothetical protein
MIGVHTEMQKLCLLAETDGFKHFLLEDSLNQCKGGVYDRLIPNGINHEVCY